MFLNYLKQVRCLALGHSSHTLVMPGTGPKTPPCVRVHLSRLTCRSWTLPVVVLGIGKRRRRRSEEHVALAEVLRSFRLHPSSPTSLAIINLPAIVHHQRASCALQQSLGFS